MARRGQKKPWRMRAKFAGKWTRPSAFGSEAAARSAARIEEAIMGATETEVWKKHDDDEGGDTWHA